MNEYAKENIEPAFDNEYSQFTSLYQRIKFSNKKPSNEDAKFLLNYYSTFTNNIKQQIKPKKRLKYYLKLNRTLTYLISYQNN